MVGVYEMSPSSSLFGSQKISSKTYEGCRVDVDAGVVTGEVCRVDVDAGVVTDMVAGVVADVVAGASQRGCGHGSISKVFNV